MGTEGGMAMPKPGDRVVLGKDPDRIQEALDFGGFFFDPGAEVLRRLEKSGIDPWRINESLLLQQEEAGCRFDLTLRGFAPDEATRLVEAFPALSEGNDTEALGILKAERLPAYAREAEWLLQRGYSYVVDEPGRVIHWHRSLGGRIGTSAMENS